MTLSASALNLIDKLPPQLAQRIYLDLSKPDRSSFRLVCKNWKKIAERSEDAIQIVFSDGRTKSDCLVQLGRPYKISSIAPAIRQVDLCKCFAMNREWFRDLKNLPNLQMLRLEGIASAKIDLSHLSHCTELHSLQFEYCPNLGNAVLENLKGLRSLKMLKLRDCPKISEIGLAHLAQFPLEYLDICLCEAVSDCGLAQISKMKQLSFLVLEDHDCDNSKITDTGIAHLVNMSQLKGLALKKCLKITESSLGVLSTLRELGYLNLSGCRLSSASVNLAIDLRVPHLDLSHNLVRSGQLILQQQSNPLGLIDVTDCKLSPSDLESSDNAFLYKGPSMTLDSRSSNFLFQHRFINNSLTEKGMKLIAENRYIETDHLSAGNLALYESKDLKKLLTHFRIGSNSKVDQLHYDLPEKDDFGAHIGGRIFQITRSISSKILSWISNKMNNFSRLLWNLIGF